VPSEQHLLHPKKVGALPVAASDELKRTNEIKTAIPLLDAIDIQGKGASFKTHRTYSLKEGTGTKFFRARW
jgi:hypothetical protein